MLDSKGSGRKWYFPRIRLPTFSTLSTEDVRKGRMRVMSIFEPRSIH